LVEEKNYPQRLLNYVPHYSFKGLLIDSHTGNLLKLNKEKRVYRAIHGKTPLTDDQINSLYEQPLADFTGHHTERFLSLSTFFEQASGPLWSEMVDIVDEQRGKQPSYKFVIEEIQCSLNFNFGDYNTGYYFNEMRTNLSRYVFKRPEVFEWLKQIHQGSDQHKPVKLFLLTNSIASYAKLLCEYVFGPEWQTVFDVVLFHGKKPSFWEDSLPFTRVSFAHDDEDSMHRFHLEEDYHSDLQPGLYNHGNASGLMVNVILIIIQSDEMSNCALGLLQIGS